MGQKIMPNLWFNGNAEEAVDFYQSVFPGSKVLFTSRYPESQEEGLADFQLELAGKVLTLDFEVFDSRFTAINAGPEFKPNPSISFMVNFDPSQMDDAKSQLDEVWNKLVEGGQVLMPLDAYPFSERYGWVQDKYGVSWQLIFTDPEGEDRPLVMPSLLFVTETCDKAEEATDFYLSVFKDSKRGAVARYPGGMEPNKEGSIMFTDFMLEEQWFAAMDGSTEMHKFAFNEGVSLSIFCKDQAEIDYFWEKLTADGGEESVCGWLKDKYGVSWQIMPENIEELMEKPGAFAKMMEMKKIVIEEF